MSIRESFSFLSVVAAVVGGGCSPARESAPADLPANQNNSHEVVAGAKAAPSPGRPASSDTRCDLPMPNVPALQDCPSVSCGGNSPILNSFPYNGLHSDGCHNADGVRMAPGAVVRDLSSCDVTGTGRLTLDIAPADPRSDSAGYELVARDDKDNIKCRGADLIGATFQVISPKLSSAIVLRISQMGTTTVSGAGTTSQGKRTAYLITPQDRPAISVCTSPPLETPLTATNPALANQPAKDGGLAPILDSALAGYAIIIPGAVYTRQATLIKESVRGGTAKDAARGHRWFNVACVGDALAESELSGIATDPIVNLETATARLPALHMLTARYCDGVSGTTRGTPIAWLRSKRSSKDRLAGAAVHSAAFTGTQPIEAQWGPNGATCLRHSRLWMANKTISLPDQLLNHKGFQDLAHPIVFPMAESEFLSRLCPGITRACGDSRKPDTLTSFAIDHVDDAD